MTTGEIRGEVAGPVWWLGWSWMYLFAAVPVVAVLVGFLLQRWFYAMTLFMVGPELPVVGLIYVHVKADDVLDAGVAAVSGVALDLLPHEDSDVEAFTLLRKTGNSLPLLPHPTRQVTTLVAAPDRVFVHDDTVVDLRTLRWEAGTRVREIRYDDIGDVTFEQRGSGGEFGVDSSGESVAWDSVHDADDVLDDLQDRLRAGGSA